MVSIIKLALFLSFSFIIINASTHFYIQYTSYFNQPRIKPVAALTGRWSTKRKWHRQVEWKLLFIILRNGLQFKQLSFFVYSITASKYYYLKGAAQWSIYRGKCGEGEGPWTRPLRRVHKALANFREELQEDGNEDLEVCEQMSPNGWVSSLINES